MQPQAQVRPEGAWRRAFDLGRDVAISAIALGLVDLALQELFLRGPRPEPFAPYAALLVVLACAWSVVHLAPAVALADIVGRRARRPELAPSLGLAALGLSLALVSLRGAGVRSHPLYAWLAIAAVVLTPLCSAALGLFAARAARTRRPLLPVLCVVASLELAWALTRFTHYRALHAHLATLLVLLGVFALRVWGPSRRLRLAALGLGSAALAILALYRPDLASLEGRILRTSYAASPLLCELPLARLTRPAPEHVVEVGTRLSPAQRARHAAALAESAAPAERAVDHVIVLVMESVRADLWGDPRVAPRFHALRGRGTYFPRAVASYPATPLAYAALFTSQPPSVVLASGSFRRARPFDRLRDGFDTLFLSRPDQHWFERSTLTDFFAPGARPRVHRDSTAALAALRATLEAGAGKRVFAWAHLYEPHAPYVRHPGHDFGGAVHERYRSELAYLDDALGSFLDWLDGWPEGARTLLVLVADHGEGLGDPSSDQPIWLHGFDVREALTAIPLYVQGPGLPAGLVERELVVSQLDVMPTLFDLLGAPLPASLRAQGRSLRALLAERPERSVVSEQFHLGDDAFYELVEDAGRLAPELRSARFTALSRDPLFASKIALRRGRDKLIYDRVLRRSFLFDVAADPGERRDLAARRPQALARMHAELEAWLDLQAWVIDELAGP